jgi:hypothetical protein
MDEISMDEVDFDLITTPTTRLRIASSTPKHAKNRVDAAVQDIGGKATFCIIEKCPAERSVEYMHCIPRSYWRKNAVVSFAARDPSPNLSDLRTS